MECEWAGTDYEECCDNCSNAIITYPEWVETFEDLEYAIFESRCGRVIKKEGGR